MKHPRYIPEGSTPIRCTIVPAVAYCYDRLNQKTGKMQYLAVAYGGNRSKADWHYRFRNQADRMAKIRSWMQGLIQHEQFKRKQRAERSKPHTLKVGQVLRSSWGYDQTNVDYYEVTKVIGRHMVEIREIAHIGVGEQGGPQERVAPKIGHYIGKPMRKRASSDNVVRIASYAFAYPYDGTPASQTGFGWGH